MKENIKKVLEFCIFVSIASLPFMITTNVLGADTFLDSFENPESYIYVKNSDSISGISVDQEKYIIIQKADHPKFKIGEKDTILYFNFDGDIICDKISDINGVGTFTRYYIGDGSNEDNPVFNSQVIGKVIKVLDNNILTDLSLKVWDMSIERLNIGSIV